MMPYCVIARIPDPETSMATRKIEFHNLDLNTALALTVQLAARPDVVFTNILEYERDEYEGDSLPGSDR